MCWNAEHEPVAVDWQMMCLVLPGINIPMVPEANRAPVQQEGAH